MKPALLDDRGKERRPVYFILAGTEDGPMILNHQDFHEKNISVGRLILQNGNYNPDQINNVGMFLAALRHTRSSVRPPYRRSV
jgi:hypothetical protein